MTKFSHSSCFNRELSFTHFKHTLHLITGGDENKNAPWKTIKLVISGFTRITDILHETNNVGCDQLQGTAKGIPSIVNPLLKCNPQVLNLRNLSDGRLLL